MAHLYASYTPAYSTDSQEWSGICGSSPGSSLVSSGARSTSVSEFEPLHSHPPSDDYIAHIRFFEVSNPTPAAYLTPTCQGTTKHRYATRSNDNSSSSSSGSSELTPCERTALVNWMTATTHALHLPSEALFLGVSLLDRCQAARVARACHTKEGAACSLEQLGLTACACLAVAAKMEAAAAPPLAAYLPYLTPGHTLAQLQQAEVEVLCALDHKLRNIATTRSFMTSALLRLAQAGAAPAALCRLCAYLAELTLLEYHLLQAPPSQLAAACLAYAALLLCGGLRNEVLRALTGYDLSKLQNTMGWVSAVHATVQAAAANSHPYAATIKYLHPGYSAVATIPATVL